MGELTDREIRDLLVRDASAGWRLRRSWTRDVEQVLRDAAPGRWADIRQMLSAAASEDP